MKSTSILLLSMFLGFALFSQNQSCKTIKFKAGNETYYFQITNDKVVGGYIKGSTRWEVMGGVQEDDRLMVIIKSDQRHDGNRWICHLYKVTPAKIILLTTLTKDGKVLQNRNVEYERVE